MFLELSISNLNYYKNLMCDAWAKLTLWVRPTHPASTPCSIAYRPHVQRSCNTLSYCPIDPQHSISSAQLPHHAKNSAEQVLEPTPPALEIWG